MHSQSNRLMADKRFDALVKQEMIEHQNIISSHHEEMQALRNMLSLSMEKFESLLKRNEQELEAFKIHTNGFVCFIKDKVYANEAIIKEQKKTIDSLNSKLDEFHDVYVSKLVAENYSNGVKLQIQENTMNHIDAFQQFQREFKTLIHSMQNDLMKSKCEMETRMCQFMDNTEKNFHISRMDKEGILKEIRIYEKTIFIIEKKIQNIYTLIERINERGIVCHKPE
jgi:hypothetical protein